MNANMNLYLLGGGVAAGGWFTYRKFAQHHLVKVLMEEYDKNPLIVGLSIYLAGYGKAPPSVKRIEVESAALVIAKRMIPIFGVKIPSTSDVLSAIMSGATEGALNNPKGVLEVLAKEGVNLDWIMTADGTDIDYDKMKAQAMAPLLALTAATGDEQLSAESWAMKAYGGMR